MDLHGAAPFATVTFETDGSRRSDWTPTAASHRPPFVRENPCRAFIPALVSKHSPASRRREEFRRDSSTDRFPLPVTFPLARQTGGAAIMRKGPNLLKLARKEQCLALLNSMRAKNKINGCVYRVFPSGEVQYLHPKDGVYPEKVNKGRVGANNNMRSIGKNANPAAIKFGGKMYKDGLASDGAGFSRVFDQ